jgi:hypothetical protein
MKYYIIKKLVKADSIKDALRQEKTAPVTDIWEDEKRIESDTERMGNVGFRI